MARKTGYDGNTNALKHGAGSAEKALQSGEAFHGPALVAETDVREEYELHGARSMVLNGAIRLEACARLYWDAIVLASKQGASVDVIDGYVARAGWLQSKALLAWAEVQKQEQAAGGKLSEVLDAYDAEAAPDESTSPQEGTGATQ